MSRIFDFKKRFGQAIDLEEIKQDFINKITHYFIEPLDKSDGRYYSEYGSSLFDFVSIEFNRNPSDIICAHNKDNHSAYGTYKPSFKIFSGRDFEKTLLLIEIFYDYFSARDTYNNDILKTINNYVAIALNQPVSTGVSWRDGKFYPEGVEEFDEKLVEDVLKWLGDNPKISALYKNALDQYSQSLIDKVKRKDVVNNAFQAVEKLTEEYLGSLKPSFDNNFNALVDKLTLDKEWKKIFNSYRELSKEFGRHAGKGDKFIPTQEDTEAFLYLSGLVLRLILQKLKGGTE